MDRWNNVQPAAFKFNDLATDNPQGFSIPTCSTAPYAQDENVVYLRNIADYGITIGCSNNQGNLKFITVSFDSSLNWNTSTSNPNQNEVDAEHVAAHELGHFSGFNGGGTGHFSNNAECDRGPSPNYDTWQTMCSSIDLIIGTDDEFGQKFRRTLETHDKHTFDGAY
jgi:hypothetical protein